MKRRHGEAEEGVEPLPGYPSLGLRGMNNLGQTCFMNTICQALCHNPLFRNYFLSECHTPNTCHSSKGRRSADRCCVACEFDALTNALYNGERIAVNPHRFLYIFWKQGMQANLSLSPRDTLSTLAGYEQQDAHEFLGAVLDTLQMHDRSIFSAPGESGVVAHCFDGMLCSSIQCAQCASVSRTKEHFRELSLEVSEAILGDRNSTTCLHECLSNFTKWETLTGQEKVHCSTCNQHQDCTKHFTVDRLPQVLVLHLKRFNHNRAARQKLRKIENYVSFPLENLDMQPFITHPTNGGGSTHLYDLSAVVEHHGDSSCHSGHYTAYIRHRWDAALQVPPSVEHDPDEYYRQRALRNKDVPHSANDWYLFDDSCIYRSSPEEVGRSQAYILFYVRQQLVYSRAP